VAPDNERFIMIWRAGEGEASELIWVHNFFGDLKRLVPN
jgi:hypothetical protein